MAAPEISDICSDIQVQNIISLALAEDYYQDDITTAATVPTNSSGTAKIIAKSAGIICGLPIVTEIVKNSQFPIFIKTDKKDGDSVITGETVLTLTGPLASLLSLERVILNFLQRLSGVATYTAKCMEILTGSSIVLLDTRKTMPGFRLLDKYAVRCGGAANHRMNLADMFLIKENHITAAGGILPALQKCHKWRADKGLTVKIEIEVTNIQEFRDAHAGKADIIMLDNFSPENIKKITEINIHPTIPLEISGNINLNNLVLYKNYPITFLSSGALTHSAMPLDLSMLLQ